MHNRATDPHLAISHKTQKTFASFAAPLILAAIVVTGLIWLAIANLDGSAVVRQFDLEHSSAIQKLLFRDAQ
jgi:hypothetical protein